MTKEKLIEALKQLYDTGDTEKAHADADNLLLQYIQDSDITTAYENVPKWYS